MGIFKKIAQAFQKEVNNQKEETTVSIPKELPKQEEQPNQQKFEEIKVQMPKLSRRPEMKWFFDEMDNIRYSIPNHMEEILVKEWDKLFSLEVFLRNLNVPDNIINNIKSSEDYYTKSMNYIEEKYIKETEITSCYSTIWNVKNKLMYEICIMTIFEKNPQKIIEKYFLLLLYRIVDSLYSYLIPNGLIENNNDYMLKMYLETFKRNETKDFKLDNQGSSFMLACQNSNMNISSIFNLGFSYIESKKGSPYIEDVINILKFDCVKNIIGKEIEHQFCFGKVDFKKLLLSQKIKKKITNDIIFRYDIPNMKNDKGYYILTEEGKKVAEQDILLSLNDIFKNGYCRTLKVEFEKEQIHFEPIENEDISDICRIIYNPYTKTGKEAKYPYYLRFVVKDIINNKGRNGTLSGEIHYLKNGNIGKVDVTFYNDSFVIKINKNDKGEIRYKEN